MLPLFPKMILVILKKMYKQIKKNNQNPLSTNPCFPNQLKILNTLKTKQRKKKKKKKLT